MRRERSLGHRCHADGKGRAAMAACTAGGNACVVHQRTGECCEVAC